MIQAMRRRNFIYSLAAPTIQFAQTAGSNDMAIAAVEIWRLEGHRDAMTGSDRQHQVNPLHIYDEHRPKEYQDQPGRMNRIPATALYLKIRTQGGLEGLYGPVDREAASVIYQQLRTFLIDKNGLAVETLWDKMYRSNRHSRAGHYMMAISALDNALWDLRGRYYKSPVYKLLGGPTRPAVEAYGSCLGYSVQPEAARRKCAELYKQGFRHQKWFMAYGPGDGAAGLKKAVQQIAVLRETLGDEAEIMFDAYMGWNLDFAIAWAKQVERYRPRWIEEAFPMDQLQSFVKLRQMTSVPVATGEHFYGRWEVNEFLKAGAVSVVQADPEWCGGVSELVKICAIASAYDAQVIPHGHSVHAALHVVASQSPATCPLVEYLIGKMSSYYHFEKHSVAPVNGKIALSDRPGFGIELDAARVEKQTLAKWS
ncbi:MAG: mandelate racemase [Acidobacteriia bacterium]|nr:mandelate racemase [Terriglobia bacterium]